MFQSSTFFRLLQGMNNPLPLSAAVGRKSQKWNIVFCQDGVFQCITAKLLRPVFVEREAIHLYHQFTSFVLLIKYDKVQ